MFLIHAHIGRTCDFSFVVYEADGTTPIQLKSTDKVIFKVGTNGQTPLIDLKSGVASANGSSVAFSVGTGDCTLHLAQGDVSLLAAGAYDGEITVLDTASSLPDNTVKYADYGVLSVHPTMTGTLT